MGNLQVNEELWAFLKENKNNPEINKVCVGPLAFIKDKILIHNGLVHFEDGRSYPMAEFKTLTETSPWTLFPAEFDSISWAINLITSTNNGKVTLNNNKSMSVIDFLNAAEKKPWRIVPEDYEIECSNQACDNVIPLQGNALKDGNSVGCPIKFCQAMTILGPPDQGLCWGYFAPCFHFAEAPKGEKPDKCGFCKKTAGFNEARNFKIPKKIGVVEKESEFKKRKLSDEDVNVDESEWRKNPEDFEIDCENDKCPTKAFSLTSIRPDGVTVACPDCKYFAPFRQPKPGFEWMQSNKCGHFYEVPKKFPPSKPEKCGFCGEAGDVFDNLASWVRIPRRK